MIFMRFRKSAAPFGALAILFAAPAYAACVCTARYVADIPNTDSALASRVNPLCVGLVTPGNVNPVTGNAITQPSAAVSLVKTVVRVDNADGSATLQVRLNGALPATVTTSDALDCVWIDTNGNGVYDDSESMRAYEATGTVVQGSGTSRTVDFVLTVPGAKGSPVCNRAFVANTATLNGPSTTQVEIESGSWMEGYSPIVCADASNPPAVVPEAQYPVVLLASALSALGLSALVTRRRIVG